MKVLSVEVPAPCPLACAFCRTPDHDQGDAGRVMQATRENLSGYDEVYVTSNGEPGLSSIFPELISAVHRGGMGLSVLCATAKSVVPGLSRAEISVNQYTEPLALRAIEKAHRLDVPVIVSMVDTGETDIDLEAVARKHGAEGVLVRGLRAEGRSHQTGGATRTYTRPGANVGLFPVEAYAEVIGHGYATTCINREGAIVALLGGRSS